MKNVLLTTTALVVFAGSAFAASHGGAGDTSISFSGEAEVKYNDPDDDVAAAEALEDALEADPDLTQDEQDAITDGFEAEDGISYSASLTVTGTAALNNGVTAGLSYGINLDDSSGDVTGDTFPVITLESAYGKLSAGDADAIGHATDHFSETDGVDGFSDGEDGGDDFMIRADVSYSSIDFSVSNSDVFAEGEETDSDLRIGASGSFGNFTFGLGYADEFEEVGLNVGTTFGAFTVDASVFNGTALTADDEDTEFGIQVGYTVNSSLSVGAYVSSHVEYGVSADYASGALTVGVAYSGGDEVADEANIDVTYDIGSGLMAYAGYTYIDEDDSVDDGAYVGLVYDLGAGAEAWVSYSEFDESGDPEFDDGLTLGVSVKF